ncbi:hypothetical protein BKA64DRAFT_742850 [Cadophora sp. MPI-SDFR-AT-0126]|nr:hypothetical protein BKA64DRAFT_742850 [Leotiomycetes sp. MPI-SDFR-AT-0126]
MLNSDGTSTAFGLTFREHDNRQMQHILRAYSRLPEGPAARSILYLALSNLETSLPDDEAQKIRDWLRGGGVLSEFPGPVAAQGPPIDGSSLLTSATFGTPVPFQLDNRRLPSIGDLSRPSRITSGYSISDDDEADSTDKDDDSNEDEDVDMKSGREEGAEGEGSIDNQADGTAPIHAPVGRYHSHNTARETEVPEGWKECCICVGQYSSDNFPETEKITTTCDHEHEELVCIRCIRDTLQSALSRGEIRRIHCPVCPELFKQEDVKKYGSPEIISRYEYLVLMATPGLIMCLGPNCGSGQVHPDNHKENPVMVCTSCHFKTCVVHKLPWHEGFSCEEFDCDESQIERLEADEATAKLLSRNSKVCPACYQGVTKTDGCDHLQCRCGQEWCFECLASWENIIRLGDTAHARHCSYHPDKVRLRSDQREANARNMAELVHGGPVSEALANARVAHNAKRRETLRPLALEAAEKRARAMKEEAEAKAKARGNPGGSSSSFTPRVKRPKLIAPWEEK